jgi:dihydropteroate synthase
MIYKTLQISPEESLSGTIALNMMALQKGAKILRVHDVKPAVQTVALFAQMEM